MFENEEPEVHLQNQATLTGNYVKHNRVAYFLIARGKKSICVVEATDYQFRKGNAQSVMGMEVAAEVNKEEVVYGVVTKYEGWQF
ncbi:hypothetical protein DVH05_014362 [Phytophthora capsici]|nr:hypothetical protein DVH05_014250 [Phytophthora capsici]KAG1698989.1 hypothetical protein DVH05_014362 [Phytophthora capsici]